jgi:hypothetical protein
MSGAETLRQSYRRLLQVVTPFSPMASCCNLSEFMELVRQYSLYEPQSESVDIAWLSAANCRADLVPVEVLAQGWIPYAFHARTHEVSWCLPQGRAVQPFYDEYISHCRHDLINTFVSPRTSLKGILQYAEQLPGLPDPSGFIFHLSRCGSTLVSGCLAQLEQCSVLSESPLLTEILLAKDISRENKKALLSACVYLQSRPSPEQPSAVVKWNAWDIFHWELIGEIWPQVPVLLLARDPVEILASHHKSPGRHMSGDPSLAHVQDVLDAGRCADLLSHRIRVLKGLMTKMLKVQRDNGVFFCDYRELGESVLMEICAHFGIEVQPHQQSLLREKLTRNAKFPQMPFQVDGEEKRQRLPDCAIGEITRNLQPLYLQLIQNPSK